jgi:hypothetical protein
MYARVTTFQSDPSRIDEMNEIRNSIKSQLANVAGLSVAFAAWNDDGAGSVMAVYDSQEAAEAAAEQIASLWGQLGEVLTEPPTAVGYTNVDNMLG